MKLFRTFAEFVNNRNYTAILSYLDEIKSVLGVLFSTPQTATRQSTPRQSAASYQLAAHSSHLGPLLAERQIVQEADEVWTAPQFEPLRQHLRSLGVKFVPGRIPPKANHSSALGQVYFAQGHVVKFTVGDKEAHMAQLLIENKSVDVPFIDVSRIDGTRFYCLVSNLVESNGSVEWQLRNACNAVKMYINGGLNMINAKSTHPDVHSAFSGPESLVQHIASRPVSKWDYDTLGRDGERPSEKADFMAICEILVRLYKVSGAVFTDIKGDNFGRDAGKLKLIDVDEFRVIESKGDVKVKTITQQAQEASPFDGF